MRAFDAQAARHESCHAVAVLQLGHQLNVVERGRSGGGTTWQLRSRGDHGWDAFQRAVVLLVPFADGGGSGQCGDDLAKLQVLLDAGVRLLPLYDVAKAMLGSPCFRRQVRCVERELLYRPRMTGAEIEEVLRKESK
jgi:hypothetical protein